MASKEVIDGLSFAAAPAEKRVQFWASTMDAFLQDFMDKAKANDTLGTIVASARLAQLGAAISDEYQANCRALVESETELKVAQQACSLVVKMCNDNGRVVIAMRDAVELRTAVDEVVPDTTTKPDRSKN